MNENENKKENTTISLPRYLKEELEEFGKKGETWVDLISRLISEIKECRKDRES